MKLSLLASALWAAGFFGHAALLFVLIVRKRWHRFPVFTSLVATDLTRTFVLYFLFRQNLHTPFAVVYWLAVAVDFVLQLALIFEIARIVFRPTSLWVQGSRSSLLWWGGLGTIAALVLCFTVKPPAPTSLYAWGIRSNLFASLLICELFLTIMIASSRLGLQWRNHVMGLGQGL